MRRWLFPAVFLVLSLSIMIVGMAIEMGLLPTSIFVFRLQTSSGIFTAIVGLIVGMLCLSTWLLFRHHKTAVRRAVADNHRSQAEVHRRFIRRLNHEIKNPLTAIKAGLTNLTSLSEAQAQDGSSSASFLNVNKQVERLGKLANDLRKLADIEAGQMEWSAVDLAEIIEEAAEMAQATPERRERAITVNVQKLPWPLSPVQGDRDLLFLAIYNLLDNALKFSGSAEAVEVRAGEDGTRASVEVVDTGRGIAGEDLAHVAEELYRGEGTEGVDGSGLGLTLVDRVAVLHGGELIVRSRKGQGTIATLRLPLWRK